MKIKDLRTTFETRLQGHYPLEEVGSFFQMAMDHFLGYSRMDIVLRLEEELTEASVKDIQQLLARLETHEPIQYIIGSTEFYGLPFKVTSDTLIPRPETEALVAWILEDQKTKEEASARNKEGRENREKRIEKSEEKRLENGGDLNESAQNDTNQSKQPLRSILDIGTGSGCIAVSLAKHLVNAKVAGYDISQGALETATQNAIANEVEVTFTQVDILQTEKLASSFDVIVSNPPYVRELEKQEIQSNVLDHEPHTALFVSNTDPLLFYRKIGQLAFDNLSGNGRLFFEINQYLGKETIQLLKDIGFTNVQLRKDIFGNDRMIKAWK
ncbi:N5-glutamine methyltransferase family protein [Dokdonia ponticola]|uniref:Release factor glutamine methyltransferase n=1 Tax=Dokdonia ponticola TaxID=2041041 RepID=A0ABV9HSQ2_9FLAO